MKGAIRREIMPGVNLNCVETSKFNTGFLSISLITGLDSETAAKNALLPNVLRRGTSRHTDMGSLSAVLYDLYGAKIEPMLRKKGELQIIGFAADYIDDARAPGGEKMTERIAALMGEILLSPLTRGGMLVSEYVESEKANLIDYINAQINDKRQYSMIRLVELMCKDENFGTDKFGTVKDVEMLNAQKLTKHYKELLPSVPIEVFYCGSLTFGEVHRAVLSALQPLPRGKLDAPASTVVVRESGTVRNFTDFMDVTQGKLALGFRTGVSISDADYPALLILNALYGATTTSKLFLNVREKLSLCYFASSTLEKHKGILMVSSGIEFSKYDDALSEILFQLEKCKKGEIEDWELESGRRAVITSTRIMMDEQPRLEEFFLEQAIESLSRSPEEAVGLLELVTLLDVVEVAKKLSLDSIYFLTGEEGGGEDTGA